MYQDTAEIIKRASVFSALSDDEAGRLAQLMEEVSLPAGASVFVEGEPGDPFFVVAEGQVEVVKALRTQEQRRLTVRGSGEYFGR